MRVAVAGGGIFGTTAAIALARSGHEVHLFERSNQLLSAASGINQYRLHAGYHYPRSPETVAECQAGLASFREEYPNAVIDGGERLYAIAKDHSKVSGTDYLAFCDHHGLKYRKRLPFTDALDVMIRVKEERIDPAILRNMVRIKLALSGVEVHLATPATIELRDHFDQIIIAGYASSNELALELDCAVEPFQFEVVEKPVIRLAEKWRDTSCVVMDGPFCSVDPFGATGLHVMGHVEHAIHATSFGLEPEVPWELERYLNKGVISVPNITAFDRFIEAGREFLPFLKRAEHMGSMFTVRAVLPDQDATDERPTLVDRLDDQVIRVFSGKIGTAVVSAQHVSKMLETTRDKTDEKVLSAA